MDHDRGRRGSTTEHDAPAAATLNSHQYPDATAKPVPPTVAIPLA